jgi:hypothetical protein
MPGAPHSIEIDRILEAGESSASKTLDNGCLLA